MKNVFTLPCDRCGQETPTVTLSAFETYPEVKLCKDCAEKERNHRDYREALEWHYGELNAGNFDFPGVGLPDDLK